MPLPWAVESHARLLKRTFPFIRRRQRRCSGAPRHKAVASLRIGLDEIDPIVSRDLITIVRRKLLNSASPGCSAGVAIEQNDNRDQAGPVGVDVVTGHESTNETERRNTCSEQRQLDRSFLQSNQ